MLFLATPLATEFPVVQRTYSGAGTRTDISSLASGDDTARLATGYYFLRAIELARGGRNHRSCEPVAANEGSCSLRVLARLSTCPISALG